MEIFIENTVIKVYRVLEFGLLKFAVWHIKHLQDAFDNIEAGLERASVLFTGHPITSLLLSLGVPYLSDGSGQLRGSQYSTRR
jgi:hypothetical protein